MRRTIIFVAIVTLVSGIAAFLLTGLVVRTGSHGADPTFASLALGMVAGMVYLLFGGNRKMPVADATERARMLAAIPPEGMARVLVVRQSMVGVLIGVDVIVDGAVLTQLKSPRFAALLLAPGRHEIVAMAQGRRTPPLPLDLAAGETAVVRISAGFKGVKLTQEADGATLRASLAKVPMVRA